MGAPHKAIKKVSPHRAFDFPTSVFCKFKPDDKRVLDEAFEHDKPLSKLPRFIKNKDDLE